MRGNLALAMSALGAHRPPMRVGQAPPPIYAMQAPMAPIMPGNGNGGGQPGYPWEACYPPWAVDNCGPRGALVFDKRDYGIRAGIPSQNMLVGPGGYCPPGAYQHTPMYGGPRCREYFLSFDSGVAVAAGATANVVLAPQVPFKGERLVIPSIIAPFFLINSLNVGNQLQQAAAGTTLAQVFSEVAVGVSLDLDPAYPGVTIQLNVTNIDDDPHRFFATLIGDAID